MSSSTWRVLSGYATYQRTPMRRTSGEKWAPLKLIAIVLLPHDGPLVTEGDHTAKGLKGKLATKPFGQPANAERPRYVLSGISASTRSASCCSDSCHPR